MAAEFVLAFATVERGLASFCVSLPVRCIASSTFFLSGFCATCDTAACLLLGGAFYSLPPLYQFAEVRQDRVQGALPFSKLPFLGDFAIYVRHFGEYCPQMIVVT